MGYKVHKIFVSYMPNIHLFRRLTMIYKVIKKIIFIIFVSLSIVLMFLLIMKLLGYNYNKDFLGEFVSFDKQKCIETEYPTYENHGGIEGCVFWAREYHLKTTQEWQASFTRDDEYCEQEYGNIAFKNLYELADQKCSFEGFRSQKRNENWDYLVSKEEDEFYKSCVDQFCSWPPLFR